MTGRRPRIGLTLDVDPDGQRYEIKQVYVDGRPVALDAAAATTGGRRGGRGVRGEARRRQIVRIIAIHQATYPREARERAVARHHSDDRREVVIELRDPRPKPEDGSNRPGLPGQAEGSDYP